MLSRRAFFSRVLGHPEARRFLLNSLAVGEADSARDLDRAAALVPDPALARRVYRHYAEELRHARVLRRHLEAEGFAATPLPPELDYERLAQSFAMGTPRVRLDDPRPFDDEDLILFFAGSTAGEERACVELAALIRDLAADRPTAAVLAAIHADERRHVAYATAALCELAARRGRRPVVRALRAARRAEARAHRAVSRAFMARLLALLGAPRLVRVAAGVSIDLSCALRWLFPGGLDAPQIADPMPVPVRPRPRAARVAP
jgi:hypothetical protein